MLYKVPTQRVPPEVTLRQIQTQAAVIELYGG